MSADEHMIVHVIRHPDGSFSSKRWPVSAERAFLVGAWLGDSVIDTHMDAATRARLAPLVAGASVVVDRREA